MNRQAFSKDHSSAQTLLELIKQEGPTSELYIPGPTQVCNLKLKEQYYTGGNVQKGHHLFERFRNFWAT